MCSSGKRKKFSRAFLVVGEIDHIPFSDCLHNIKSERMSGEIAKSAEAHAPTAPEKCSKRQMQAVLC